MLPRPPRRPPIGKVGEELAAAEYERRGAKILGRNIRNSGGEMDLVAQEGSVVIAVEVKTRTQECVERAARFGRPADAVDPHRILRLGRALSLYAAIQAPNAPLRIDVAEVFVNSEGRCLQIRILENVTK